VKIKLNGQEKQLLDPQDLQAIVEQFCKKDQNIIVEVNGEIIKNPQWNTTHLKDGDSVELLNFVGGG